MASFKYVSARGDILPLSEAENFRLVNIDGQTAATANISSIVLGDTDGAIVNNTQAQPRTIILDLSIISDIEKTKREILNIVKFKQQGSLIWQQDDRELEIKGVIEAIEMPRWQNGILMQITMFCAQPYWENIDYVVSQISEAIDLHYFTDFPNEMLYFIEPGIVLGEYDTTRTKKFHNAGDVSVGLEIEILALDTVTNPIIYAEDGSFFGCGYGAGNKRVIMAAGDVVKIITRKNEKAVTLNGASILNKIKPSSTWLQLAAGDNQFTINSDDESFQNMQFSLIYKQRYI